MIQFRDDQESKKVCHVLDFFKHSEDLKVCDMPYFRESKMHCYFNCRKFGKGKKYENEAGENKEGKTKMSD